MIPRRTYLDQLVRMKDKPIIKVVTGIRRAGKSTLLLQFIEHLKDSGIEEDKIIYLNMESAQYDDVTDYKGLYGTVKNRIVGRDRYYVIVDEVQNVEMFEKAVNSIMVDFDVDLYLTGSNAKMLSSELATLLSGRYVEIRVLPLSFAEYYSACEGETKEDAFFNYMKYGGFPFLATEREERIALSYLEGIYNTIILKDVATRNKLRDIALLEKILKVLLSSLGSPVSASSISKTLKSEKRQVSNETIERYLGMLEEAFIVDKTLRYDIKGKDYLKTLGKYYVADIGLRNYTLGFRQIEPGQALENIVYMELIKRGYHVDTGKVGENEIDFVARNQQGTSYYQVSYTVNGSKDTLERELRPFKEASDHNSRVLLTMDRDFVNDIDGIKKRYIIDWLLEKD